MKRAQGMFLYPPDDRLSYVKPLAMITVPHAHTAYVQCGRADSTNKRRLDIQTNTRIIGQAAVTQTWRLKNPQMRCCCCFGVEIS
jgi:hypothetical protein